MLKSVVMAYHFIGPDGPTDRCVTLKLSCLRGWLSVKPSFTCSSKSTVFLWYHRSKYFEVKIGPIREQLNSFPFTTIPFFQ